MGWSSTSDECKDCSPEQLKKECMNSNLKALRYTRKRPLYADGRRQLRGEPPMHIKSVVKNFYNRDIVSDLMMTEEVPHGYVPVFQQDILY
jgi:hypothetical protein